MDNYFQARNVDEKMYINQKLPAYFQEVIQTLKPNAKILDFGCGFGQILYAIKQKNFNWINSNGGGGYDIFGIDINPYAIDYVKNLGIKAIVCQNIFDFIPEQKFDLIITTHVLEHLPKDKIIDTLKHLRKNVLSKNGKIFIAVPNAQSNTSCYWAYEDFTHNTLFTAGSLIYVLKMAGFKDIQIIDKDAMAGTKGFKKYIRKFFLKLYKLKIAFWNRMTNSAFHAPSPQVFSYEIKALAQ